MFGIAVCLVLTVSTISVQSCSVTSADIAGKLAELSALDINNPVAARDLMNETCFSLKALWTGANAGCNWGKFDEIYNITAQSVPFPLQINPIVLTFEKLCGTECYRPWIAAYDLRDILGTDEALVDRVSLLTQTETCHQLNLMQVVACPNGTADNVTCQQEVSVRQCTKHRNNGYYDEIANITFICGQNDGFADNLADIASGWETCNASTDARFDEYISPANHNGGNILRMAGFHRGLCPQINNETFMCPFNASTTYKFKHCMDLAQEKFDKAKAAGLDDEERLEKEEEHRCDNAICATAFNDREACGNKNADTYYMWAANMRNGHMFALYCRSASSVIQASFYVIFIALLLTMTS